MYLGTMSTVVIVTDIWKGIFSLQNIIIYQFSINTVF